MSNIKNTEEIILAQISPEALKTIQRVLETGGEITGVTVQVSVKLPDGSSKTTTVNPLGKLNLVICEHLHLESGWFCGGYAEIC